MSTFNLDFELHERSRIQLVPFFTTNFDLNSILICPVYNKVGYLYRDSGDGVGKELRK